MGPLRVLCPTCRKVYVHRIPAISCCVAHAPGTCCHYGQTEVTDGLD